MEIKMGNYRVALLVKNSGSEEFVVVRQTRPPAIPLEDDQPGHCHVDSDLWDLPSSFLSHKDHLINYEFDSAFNKIITDVHNALENLGLRGFDASSSVQEIRMQVFAGRHMTQPWTQWKLVKEADFGPGLPISTLFFITEVKSDECVLSEESKWLSFSEALKLLVHVTPRDDRVGPLATIAAAPVGESLHLKLNIQLECQEYPPGVLVVPMNSRTLRPFKKTNLVVFAPEGCSDAISGDSKFAVCANALIMDPGCHFRVHDQLAEIVASLPRKLVIFVTHHHHDHVEGLSTIKRCNPNAVLLGHEATIRRIGKDASGIRSLNVHGGATLCIGGQEFNVISAPGHTDGHMALLHVMTHTLIVGDHCVGEGSSVLDPTSGGNMKDYLDTTRQFLELSPHSIIPMHGRPNVWPTNLLCGYIKHRKQRESKILKAIEGGARTLYEVVSKAYTDVHPNMWMGAAYNVKLHVEHLSYQQKLPMEFSMDRFLTSSGFPFLWSWLLKTAQTNRYLRFAGKICPVLFVGLGSYLFFRSNILAKGLTSSDISQPSKK